MAIFKKKHEFKPDKERSGALNKLYITKKQRRNIAKWLLMALALVLVGSAAFFLLVMRDGAAAESSAAKPGKTEETAQPEKEVVSV